MSAIYFKSGRGVPVMLVHGYGENHHVWDEVLPHLPKKFKYILPDLPGFGDQPALEHATMEIYADHLNAILKLERIEKIILLGHSMGGYITMAFANRFPEKIKAIGLIHSHVFADTELQIEARKKAIGFIQRNGAKKYLKDFVKNLFAETTNKKIIAQHLHTVIQTSEAGLIAALNAMIKRHNTSQVLKQCAVPVLFMFGRNDKLMPVEKMLSQCNIPDQCTVEILEKSGHMGTLEEPGRCGEVMSGFLGER